MKKNFSEFRPAQVITMFIGCFALRTNEDINNEMENITADDWLPFKGDLNEPITRSE